MLNIESLQNGIVIDHITAGKGMKVYELLGLSELDCCVAVIQNARSQKFGKKDIIKIDAMFEVNLEVLGFVSENATVSIIKNGTRVDKKKIVLPKKLVNVVKCKNPRCISFVEEDLEQVFVLSKESDRKYRCVYCEQECFV